MGDRVRTGTSFHHSRRGRQTDLVREDERLPDGRRIIYYTFDDEEDEDSSGDSREEEGQ
jgi:hypothetical protein